ncbi:hypothetical protein MKK70_09685 [Methylobacterium sp. E-041]|uniref:hypothetical protein n=1 Tax=Methylobacterium sp. E-041 TaxID=2836573 RepID=UPI001FBAFBA0|nr:hypothetical protein [Methylobacterium sp. E-041]MCJ2105641.1 hypothetical protein [Methylobacterium sp. E-041]
MRQRQPRQHSGGVAMGEAVRRIVDLPANIPKRGLSKHEAAAYCGCETMDAFNTWVKRKIVPGPIPGTSRWDRLAIDAALDRLSGLAKDKGDDFDQWARKNAD